MLYSYVGLIGLLSPSYDRLRAPGNCGRWAIARAGHCRRRARNNLHPDKRHRHHVTSTKRRNKTRLLIAGVAVLALVFGALLVPIPFRGRSASALGDLVHAPLFGSLGLAVLWGWQQLRPLQRRQSKLGRRLVLRGVSVWVTLSTFGLGMEILQSLSGRRSGTLHDTIANSLGVGAAVCAYACFWFLIHQRRIIGWTFLAAAAMLLGIAWYRPTRMLLDVLAVPHRFPLLASFETDLEFQRWYARDATLSQSHDYVTHGKHSLKVRYTPIDFTAITLFEMPFDWSGAETIEIDATLDPSHACETVTLFLQIFSETESITRTKEFVLRRGETVRVRWEELSKAGLDLADIRYVDVGISEPTEPVTIYFDRLTLALGGHKTSSE